APSFRGAQCMSDDQRRLAQAARMYALVLHLYPRAHRQGFGEQMLQAFRDHYHDAVETAGESAWRFWGGVIADEGKSLFREHLAALQGGDRMMKRWKQILLVSLPLVLMYGLNFLSQVNERDPLRTLPAALQLVGLAVLLLMLASFLRAVSPSGIGR